MRNKKTYRAVRFESFTFIMFIFTALCLCACQKEDLRPESADREELIAKGRYLAASNASSNATTNATSNTSSDEASGSEDYALIEDHNESKWFESGTPFRLLAYAKPYKTDGEAKFRFNKVAWDGEIDGLKFINIDSDPDKWFGFFPIGDEVGGADGLVSLYFYGFTYGEVSDERSGYIVLDQDQVGGAGSGSSTGSGAAAGSESVAASATAPLSELTRTESVDEKGKLKDLMIGQLADQNIESAGKDAETDNQSIIPFKHCFSLLHFLVVQQHKENSESEGFFPDIYVTDVKLTNTYNSGTVYLENGKIKLPSTPDVRKLTLTKTVKTESGTETKVETSQVNVTTKLSEIGEMLVFPSDGKYLTDKPDGYNSGLEITFKCPDEVTRKRFIDNFESSDYQSYRTEDKADGFYMTIVKTKLMTPKSDGTEEVLRFRQNTEYSLVVSFQNNMVRVITAVPTVEEWLLGEGTTDDPWKDQAIGQPQMFDNIVWSDRNLGADHFDPNNENGRNFENTIGYFYQSGRNIPYYPYNYLTDKTPDFGMMHDQKFADKSMKWQNTDYRFYPIIDHRILKMTGNSDWTMYQGVNEGNHPQMIVSEKKPEGNYYFDFLRGSSAETSSGLNSQQDMKWGESRYYQPTSGAWQIPTSNDFLKIFPSTPFAGNITMRDGNYEANPMNWGQGTDCPVTFSESEQKTLRVTVPFYEYGSSNKPTDRSAAYQNAWQTLKNHNDEGTTHLGKYVHGQPNLYNNLRIEPEGDPEDGYASVYIISGEPQDTVSLSQRLINSNDFRIKHWGTIYAIKRVYTQQAYRMRWRALIAMEGKKNPCLYIEICRYRCEANDHLTEENFKKDYDWDHPAARLYFPVCGLGDWTGEFINFGTECQYATSDPISEDGKTDAVHIKITGDNASNAYIAVLQDVINRNFAKQIRPIGGVIND